MPSLYRRPLHRPLAWVSHGMLLLVAATTVLLIVDDRSLLGVAAWWKPWKFAVSLWIYTLTLAWLIPMLAKAPRSAWWAGNVVAGAAALEMILIAMQVARGTRSHFNYETAIDTLVWQSMGTAIILLWLVTLFLATLLLRQGLDDKVLTSALRLGLVVALAGMAIGFLMTSPTAEQMESLRAGAVASTIGAHSVGVPDGGPGLPVIGWSTVGGDLRVPHFLGLHALQALPLLAFGLSRSRIGPDGHRRRLIRVVAGGYAGLVGLTTWQALRGQPVFSPDALTLTAAGVLVAAVAVGLLVTHLGRPRP